jgi:hypothetical protein
MPRQKNRVVKVVIRFDDLEKFQSVIDYLKSGQAYFKMGGKLLLENMKRDIERDIFEPMLIELQKYPKKPDYKYGEFPWKTEKQRRYVMAMVSEGKIKLPYKRTGKLAAGWDYEVELRFGRNNVMTLRVYNDSTSALSGKPFMEYVMGDIGLGVSTRSIQRYARPQQPFHEDRWQLAYEIIQPAYVQAQEYIEVAIDEWIVTGIEIGRV